MSQLIILFNIVVWLHPLVLLCDAVEFFFCFLFLHVESCLCCCCSWTSFSRVMLTESVESVWLICRIGSRALNLPYPQLHQYQGWLSFGLLGLRVLASFELIRQRRSFLFLACVIHIAVISCSSRCYGVYAWGRLLKFVYRSVWRNHSVIVGSLVIWIIRFCVKNSFIAYVRHYFMSRIFMYGR